MIISLKNQELTDKVSIENGLFSIEFDDPAYVRADMIVVHSSNRELGMVFSEGYHTIGKVPEEITLTDFQGVKEAFLKATRVDGSILQLSAPLYMN